MQPSFARSPPICHRDCVLQVASTSILHGLVFKFGYAYLENFQTRARHYLTSKIEDLRFGTLYYFPNR